MDKIVDIAGHPLVLPIAAALVIGAVAFVLARWSVGCGRLLGLAAAVAVGACGIQVQRAGATAALSQTWADLGAGIVLRVDLTTTPLGMLVWIASAAFAVLIAVYSVRGMPGLWREGRFGAYLAWTLASVCLVATAGNLLVLLVGWELVTLMLFFMLNQGRGDSRAGAAKTYGILGFADACLLLALALLASLDGGTDNWSLTAAPRSVADLGPLGYAVYALILVAGLAKAGAVPLHTWIPSAAKDAPTPVMALLPAALDKLLGIYLLAVLSLQMFRPDGAMQVVMMVIGAVTILSAVLMAMMQHNLKRLLSFHAVSQVGYMVLGLGTGTLLGVLGGLFHMLNNAIYKSSLFLMSGSVERACGTDEIEKMGGLARVLPITFASTLIAAGAISGVPPLNGFASKWLIYQGALQVSQTHAGLAVALVTAAVFGSAMTLASFVKVLYAGFLSPAPTGPEALPQPKKFAESFFLAAPMVVLAGACVVLGLWPELVIGRILVPAVAAGQTELAVSATQLKSGSLGFWSPAQATGLIVLGVLGGVALVFILGASRKVRVVRPFVGGEVPGPDDDRFRLPATGFYATIAEMPVIGPLLAGGEQGAMDVYHWSGRHGNTFVQMLRSWHTGLISLYVTWCLLGLTATLLYLLLAGRS